jgi:energy-converting hydrogenase Eha subunit G
MDLSTTHDVPHRRLLTVAGVAGIAFLLLLQGLTVLAAPALVLLLLFITGAGITVGAAKDNRRPGGVGWT